MKSQGRALQFIYALIRQFGGPNGRSPARSYRQANFIWHHGRADTGPASLVLVRSWAAQVFEFPTFSLTPPFPAGFSFSVIIVAPPLGECRQSRFGVALLGIDEHRPADTSPGGRHDRKGFRYPRGVVARAFVPSTRATLQVEFDREEPGPGRRTTSLETLSSSVHSLRSP